MNLTGIKSIAIPEGNVKAIHSGGTLLWSAPADDYVVEYTWEGVAASIQRGTYATDYKVGDLIPLDLGSEGLINMQIAAFDADELADGSGTAHISFVAKELLVTSHRMNPSYSAGTLGTGSLGGWKESDMRKYVQSTIKAIIPADVLAMVKTVNKISISYDVNGTKIANEVTADDLWIPSSREIGISSKETTGVEYNTTLFLSNASRKKLSSTTGNADKWWVRTAYSTSRYCWVNESGSAGNAYQSGMPTALYGIALGFCV